MWRHWCGEKERNRGPPCWKLMEGVSFICCWLRKVRKAGRNQWAADKVVELALVQSSKCLQLKQAAIGQRLQIISAQRLWIISNQPGQFQDLRYERLLLKRSRPDLRVYLHFPCHNHDKQMRANHGYQGNSNTSFSSLRGLILFGILAWVTPRRPNHHNSLIQRDRWPNIMVSLKDEWCSGSEERHAAGSGSGWRAMWQGVTSYSRGIFPSTVNSSGSIFVVTNGCNF